MIAFVSGRVAGLAPDSAVVDVGGVGLSVHCTPSTLARLRMGERATVPTSLVVREDSLTLYGFADEDERTVFELLQTASGVGPRLALAMLAVHAPNALRRAVVTGEVGVLTKVPGIGRKGAQRIILELKDRLGASSDDLDLDGAAATAAAPWREQVHGALVNLGWSSREADEAVSAVAGEVPADGSAPDIAALLRTALSRLSHR